MDSIAQYYREINSGFLNQEMPQKFDIFTQVENGDEPRFMKFTDYTIDNHDKIRDLLEQGDGQSYFIHENDLIKYYKDNLIKNLHRKLEKDSDPRELLETAYAVAIRILKEYLENIGSPRVLRTLSDIVSVVEACLSREDIEFPQVFRFTRKENHTYTHCVNVGFYCMVLASKLKMKPEIVRELGLGGMLSDIGKKSVPFEILSKSGPLTPEEFKQIRRHPAASKKVLNDMKCFSSNILQMSGEHHEKFNGEGYPLGLVGERISLYGRVCAIMDVFSALSSQRYTREPSTLFETLSIMKTQMPGHFDERILVNFIKTLAGKTVA